MPLVRLHGQPPEAYQETGDVIPKSLITDREYFANLAAVCSFNHNLDLFSCDLLESLHRSLLHELVSSSI